MKNSFLILLSCLLIVRCQNCQSQPTKAAKQTPAAAASIRQGATPTTTGGFTLTSKINRTTWSPISILPAAAAAIFFASVGLGTTKNCKIEIIKADDDCVEGNFTLPAA